MREESLKNLKAAEFKRLTGVNRETFEKMRDVVESKAAKFGRPPKQSSGDQVLMTLMYWREYRTQFHIAQTYSVSESHVSRTVRKVEDILMKSGQITLPGKKVLQSSDWVIEVVLVDAAEQPIERPQKNSVGTTAARRNAILKKLS
jgi:hypothetical protein